MQFKIDPSRGTAIFQQLIQRIKEHIASGRLKPGDRLPAVREMALSLLINPNTVQKAYGELASDGLIYSHKGKGMFIAEASSKLRDEERQRRVEGMVDGLITEAILLGFSREDISRILDERLEGFTGGAQS
jgi:GntR family transcriptional regulator